MKAFRLLSYLLANTAGLCAVASVGAADLSGTDVYIQRCAVCHDANSGDNRAPSKTALRQMSANNVLLALESGVMQQQAMALSAAEKRNVAEFVTGKTLTSASAAQSDTGKCVAAASDFSPAGKNWNGWSADNANTRFQPADAADLAAADVPRLRLKWVFGFADASTVNAQPSIVGGRIFVGSANRRVYSLDANSGCQYWSYAADAAVRTAISVAMIDGAPPRHLAFFGDALANAYAVDAQTGELVWKVKADAYQYSRIIGAPVYYNKRLFVPIAAAEEGRATDPKFECCSGRGALVALDAATGAQLWKTYTIDEQPQMTGKNPVGTPVWGPSGASIWSAPTIDSDRNIVYVATGDNFTHPATARSDAIVAFDMQSGKILWTRQVTRKDIFNNACIAEHRENCPKDAGPDADFGSSPMLIKLAGGRRMLLAGQKSGVAYGFDPDRRGKIMWSTRVGKGGIVGGIQFGPATDGNHMYAAVSDMKFDITNWRPGAAKIDPQVGGGLFALDVLNGKIVWSAPPPVCGDRPGCSPAQSAAVSVIPGVVFSGSVDGHLRAYATTTGKVVWDIDTVREYTSVNGVAVKGGSLNGPGATIAGGMLFVGSGYGSGQNGNALLAFSVDGK